MLNITLLEITSKDNTEMNPAMGQQVFKAYTDK